MGIGKTKARELLNNPKNRFTVRIDDCDLQILYNMLMAGISMQKGLKKNGVWI